MKDLEKGITDNSVGYRETTWNIFGQTYFPKAICETTFAGDFVPVLVHPTKDEFILVQEGELDLKIDGKWTKAYPGDVVRMPKGIPHGYSTSLTNPAAHDLDFLSPEANE